MGLTINLSGVSKSYGGKPALIGLSHDFEPGGIYSIMGPNGSGKSTLLRLCALLEPPDAGRINYLESNNILNNDMTLKRRITLVLPRPALFNAAVFKNAAYGLSIRGMERDAIKIKVEAMLEKVGLLGKSGLSALSLSSGEAQRLSLARAMVIEPDVLFLDEPTAFVDEANTAIIEELILSMRHQGKQTIVMATHDRAQAERLSDGVLLIRDGYAG